MYDFANLLFSGPCNARCPTCIGRQLDPRLNTNNLDEFPPRNLDRFTALIREHGIREVVFTGTTTDPQLYRHEARLLAHLRERLPAGTRFSLHTNGRLALRKMDTFNLYDRVCLSLPSFDPETYRKMMGVAGIPDLAEILRRAAIPVKVSCLATDDNAAQLESYLEQCAATGVRRVVLRKLFGERRGWEELTPFFPPIAAGYLPVESIISSGRRWGDERGVYCGDYRGNPVYEFKDPRGLGDPGGLEVTLWDFDRSESTSLNLFSTGVISSEYLLARARPGGNGARMAAD